MAETFNFGEYLLENGFAYSNYGDHQLYEIEKDGENYAVNIQGDKFTHNDSKSGELKTDVKVPDRKTDATKWLKGFLQ